MWLMRNLVVSLVEHERISTTLAKAKELRRWADKAVTLGKRGQLADRRLLLSRIPNQDTVRKVFAELAPRFKDRQGGYTRIYKTGRRPGDNAEMALIEFIDAQVKKVSKDTAEKSKKAQKKLAQSPEQKEAKAKAKAAKKEAKATKKATSKGEGKAKKKK
jgi:large subunit ribosomal protein L17